MFWKKEKRFLEKVVSKVDELTKAINDLNSAIAALQSRTVGAVPLATVQAAAVQIQAAVTTLNSIS